MGWGFRKSFKFGPMRLNFSKSGIGVSAGVRGARISAGPRGTYLNVGRGGLYYRQKIGGAAGTRASTAYAPQPEAVAEALPQDSLYQYPQFPKHGLPRIVTTLSLMLIPVAVVGVWLLAVYSQAPNARTGAASVGQPSKSSPVPYSLLPEYVKNGRPLKNILIRPKTDKDSLIQLAKYLHSSSPQANFRIFDDDAQFQKFMGWDVNYPSKTYPYPKSWADKHYIGDVSYKTAGAGGEWQLTDQTGKKLASLD